MNMKQTFNIFIIMFSLIFSTFVYVDNSQAFLKTDIGKPVQKVTQWVNTIKSKCEKLIEKVQSSQLGQFVSSGIEHTKKGIEYAKNLYNRAEELKDTKEYKAALLSKKLAEESKKIISLQEAKLAKLEDLGEEKALLEEQMRGKVANVDTNLSVVASSSNPESRKAIEDQMAALNIETELKLKDMEMKAQEIKDEYDERIKDQSEVIADISLQISELAGVNTSKITNASEDIKKNISELFASGESVGILEEANLRKRRREKMSSTAEKVFANTAQNLMERTEREDKISSTEDLGLTMTSEEARSSVNADMISQQLDVLRILITTMIDELKTQTTADINAMYQTKTFQVGEKFNLCDYSIQKKQGSLLNSLKKEVSSAKEAISKAKEQVNSVKETGQQIKDDIKTKAEEAKQLKENIQGFADEVSGLGIDQIVMEGM